MPDNKKLKMCPDPDCAKESPENAEVCIGCGLDFESFNVLDRVLGVRERRKLAEEKEKKPKGHTSVLDSLRRRK